MGSWNMGMDGRGECRLTAQEMDEMRHQNVAYQYLCHLEEARKWMEACIEEEVPPVEGLEEQLRHGVYLAKLAHFFAPDTVPLRKIFDLDLSRYNAGGLHFRHTDNINHFLRAMKAIGLPSIFYPETTDIYDGKNMPRVVFCLHALSLYLFRLGIAPQIQNLYGKVKFSDEVMAAMMSELNKYGYQMPQFGKIGGILASELPVDEAALHAAIIAINEAIDKQDTKELLDTLENTTCHLENIDPEHGEAYLQTLAMSKQRKKDIALEKSRDENYIPDAYDELLTHVEIQGHVNSTNVLCALIKVEDAVVEERKSDLLAALQLPYLMLKGVTHKNAAEYMECLKEEMSRPHEQSLDLSLNHSLTPCSITRTILRQVIQRVNEKKNVQDQLLDAVKFVNKSLECGSPEQTLEALKSFGCNMNELLDFAAPLYHEEMAAMQEDMQGDLTLEEIQGGVKMLTAIAHVNATLRTHNPQELLHYLQAPSAYLQGIDEQNSRKYYSALMTAAQRKNTSQETCPFLTYLDLQTVIDDVNEQVQEDNEKIGALTSLNSALDRDSVEETMRALKHPALKLKGFKAHDALHHFHLLKLLRTAKREMLEDDTVELWIEDLSDCVKAVNRHVEEAENLLTIMMRINKGLVEGDLSLVTQLIEKEPLFNVATSRENVSKIVEHLRHIVEEKRKVPVENHWLQHHLHDGSKIFLNMESGKYQWEEPKRISTSYITLDDIFSVAKEVNILDHNKRKVEGVVVKFQALARGYLVRQRYKDLHRAATVIQSWWRMQHIRWMYSRYCRSIRKFEPQIVVIQRAVRAWLCRKRIKALSTHFSKHEHHVLVIQRAWRSYKARQDLRALTHCDKPSLAVVRKFLDLLDVSATDFSEELRLQKVKNDIVKTIRRTHNLENEVDQMDVKIGLLVHNRITLQDVIPIEKENMNPNVGEVGGPKKHRSKGSKELPRFGTLKLSKGLKALTKDSREKLVGYQHLFYLLQTQPHYLATLIFALPPSKTTKFIENVIFTLYNYGSSDRDCYLLLKLFKTALEEEIRCKVLRLSDIVSGNPLIVKMIVSFNRKGAGQASLQEMLGPLVRKVLGDSSIQINTNPVEIYQTWVNQKEMQTGQPSGLPYVVTQEEALKYPEVQKRLSRAIQSLKEATAAFCEHITNSQHLIPYAMLYMAKILRAALHRRFPHIPEKEILKVVGNLVYYRYINSAIVAPDAFDIVTVSPDQKLTSDQRRNLASIAKVLQFAASKKGFGEEEAAHLTCLNPFIIECHEKFKLFFRHCCEVEDPEDMYNVNQYSEATLIIKPTVYITVQEMCETHQLLLDNESILAPDSSDPLHELLSDLGERPALHTLIGEVPESNAAACGRTEVCLALTSKFDIPENIDDSKDTKDSSKLFNRSKQMLIEVITCVEGDQITALVSGATTSEEERKYRQLVMNRAENERQAKLNDTALNRSNSFLADARVNLHDIKTRLSHNLRRLENQGIASRNDNYQTILNAIAQDIVSQRQYRINRKQELYKHLMTEKQLEAKEKFYKDQLESYKTYLNTCLSNMAVRNKNVHQASNKLGEKEREKVRLKATLKYTAWKLHEKGVVLEIEGLPQSQLKNVLFEITPLATTGVFQVQVRFMGVAMETVQVDIQDLLQLQYEGVSVKQMMRKAKVNVNLLLHLLNTKFYSKKK